MVGLGVMAAIAAIEEIAKDAPQIYAGIGKLAAMVKRGLSGGPDPTPEEIAAGREESRRGIAQMQKDVDEG